MTFQIFDKTKTVKVDSNLIKEFEENLYSFHSHTAEYLILGEDLSRDAAEEEMEAAIEKGIQYELFMAKNSPEVIGQAIRKGIIK